MTMNSKGQMRPEGMPRVPMEAIPNISPAIAQHAANECERLRGMNAELLAALQDMVHYDDLPEAEQAPAMAKARAAIAKAQIRKLSGTRTNATDTTTPST